MPVRECRNGNKYDFFPLYCNTYEGWLYMNAEQREYQYKLKDDLMQRFLTIAVVFLLVMTVFNYLVYPPACGHIVLASSLSLAGLKLLHLKGITPHHTASLLFTGFTIFITIPLCVYFTGGIQSPIIFWFIVVPIGSLMVFGGGRRAIFLTAASLLIIAFFAFLKAANIQAPAFNAYYPVTAITGSVVFLIVMLFYLTRLSESQKSEALTYLETEKELFLKHSAQVPGVIYQFQLFKDGRSRYLFISDGVKDLLDIEPEAVKANSELLFNRIHPDDLPGIRSKLVASIKTMTNWTYEGRMVVPGRGTKWVKGSARPETQADGSTAWYGYIYDVTEEKKAEEALIESQRSFRQITSTINDVFYLYDIANKKYLFISPNCKSILGVDDYFFYEGSSHTKQFVHPDDKEKLREANIQVDAGFAYDIDFRLYIDGELRWLNEKSYPIKDQLGNAIKNSGVVSDITGRKLMEEKLLETQANIRQITSTINDTFFLYDTAAKKYLYMSPNCEAVLGVADAYFYGGSNYTEKYVHPADKEIMYAAYDKLETGGEYNLDYRIILNGQTRWLNEKSYAIDDGAGNTVKISGIVTDITTRRLAEEKQLKSQRGFEEAQELAQIGSWEFSFFDMTPSWSKEMYRIFELENIPEKELFAAFQKRIHPEDLKTLEAGIRTVITEGLVHSIEIRMIPAAGGIKYVSAIAEPVKSEKSKKIIGIRGAVQDITRQKLAALAKSDFLSTMSHEIRTPINGVVGITNLLLDEELTPVQKEYIETLNFSAQHLSTIVSDILDFSKIESGSFEFEKLPFNLEQVCNNIFRLFQSKAVEKNLVYRFTPAPVKEITFYGDYVRLSQVLSNLLSNAVKFTRQGSVDFSYHAVSQNEKRIKMAFVVKDTGIGIQTSQQSRIFESFLQADTTVTREYGGTGLGLTICKRLVELQGGSIRMESQPGAGSVFTIELTFDKKQGAVTAPDAETLRYAGMPVLKGMKVLVAEDNKINTLVLTRFLKKWQVENKVAENGRQAIELLQQERFDAVLMDLQMPVMDGREATRLIRQSANAAISGIPVIALTADALVESQNALLANGFNDCITKPFSPELLFKLLEKYYRN
jgi:PAS domain S-box-containing protein